LNYKHLAIFAVVGIGAAYFIITFFPVIQNFVAPKTLAQQRADLYWDKYCTTYDIDPIKCASLRAQQESINTATQEEAARQALIRQQQQEAQRLEAERLSEQERLAAEQEAARLQAIADKEEAERQALAAAKLAKQMDLATPKEGYIEITAAKLDSDGTSSVTIHNLIPNTCNGKNWCNIVVIDKIFVNGEQTRWARASQNFVILAEGFDNGWGYSTMPFTNKTYDSGTIRIEGYEKDTSQRIFAEYRVR